MFVPYQAPVLHLLISVSIAQLLQEPVDYITYCCNSFSFVNLEILTKDFIGKITSKTVDTDDSFSVPFSISTQMALLLYQPASP